MKSRPFFQSRSAEPNPCVLNAFANLIANIPTIRRQPAIAQFSLLQSLGLSSEEAKLVLTTVRGLPTFHNSIFDTLQDTFGSKCEIQWQPDVLHPVFYGIRDYAGDAVPGLLRVFYPSLDGAVMDAPFLGGCGRYPLVIFLHGHCGDTEHYKSWYFLPATLARSGFVVVVPHLPFISSGTGPFSGDQDLNLALNVIDWMHTQWEHRDNLMPVIGIASHSFGALLGGLLATRTKAAAYVSLSGVWRSWPSSPPSPLGSWSIPSLYMWGDCLEDFVECEADLDGDLGNLFKGLPTPKHKLIFSGGHHFDYLPDAFTTCEGPFGRGPCTLTHALAADFTALFLSKHVPPEFATNLKNDIGDSLLPPVVDLTIEQQFFAGAHLNSLSIVGAADDCTGLLAWDTGSDQGSITI